MTNRYKVIIYTTFLIICMSCCCGLMMYSCQSKKGMDESNGDEFKKMVFYNPPSMIPAAWFLNKDKLLDDKLFPLMPDSNKNIYINIGANYFIITYQLFQNNRRIYGFDSLIKNNTMINKYFSEYITIENRDTLLEQLFLNYYMDCGFEDIHKWLCHKSNESICNPIQSSILFGSWLEANYINIQFLKKNIISVDRFTETTASNSNLIYHYKEYYRDITSKLYLKEILYIDSITKLCIECDGDGRFYLENDSIKNTTTKCWIEKNYFDKLIERIEIVRNRYL